MKINDYAPRFTSTSQRNSLLHDTVFTFSVITAISTLFVTSSRNLKPSTAQLLRCCCLPEVRRYRKPLYSRLHVDGCHDTGTYSTVSATRNELKTPGTYIVKQHNTSLHNLFIWNTAHRATDNINTV